MDNGCSLQRSQRLSQASLWVRNVGLQVEDDVRVPEVKPALGADDEAVCLQGQAVQTSWVEKYPVEQMILNQNLENMIDMMNIRSTKDIKGLHSRL